jgi:hypothetical protein
MAVLYILLLVILAKIVLVDSPVGNAVAEAIRSLMPTRASGDGVSRAELESLRRDVEELRDRVERVVEEQSFLTRLLSEPRPLSLGPGRVEDPETRE